MKAVNLAQSLAMDSQLHLPGSAGRLLKQIRDIEQVAPLFQELGLVKSVKKPTVVDLEVAGIATRSCLEKALGGFIYVSAAVRTDLRIEANKVGTRGTDSVSELDDIDFEAQRKRLDLIEIRQGYELVEKLLNSDQKTDLILLDTPLFLARDMAPLARDVRHKKEYERTRETIENFWLNHRAALFPWNPLGPVLVSILAERFSAVVSIAKQDLRTVEGRKHLLLDDGFNEVSNERLQSIESSLSGIGDLRFINGILGSFSRTIAFRLSDENSRIEPASAVSMGLIGFHFRSARAGQIKLAQLAGEAKDWSSELLDSVACQLMVLDMQSHKKAMALPQVLGYQQLEILPKFAAYYRKGLHGALRNNEVETTWLSGLDEGLE